MCEVKGRGRGSIPATQRNRSIDGSIFRISTYYELLPREGGRDVSSRLELEDV